MSHVSLRERPREHWLRPPPVEVAPRVPGSDNGPRLEEVGLPSRPPVEPSPTALVGTTSDAAWDTDGTPSALAPLLDALEAGLGGLALDTALLSFPAAWTHDGLQICAIDRASESLGRDDVLDLAVARALYLHGGPSAALLAAWFAAVTVDEARGLRARHAERLRAHPEHLERLFPAAVRQVLVRDPEAPVGPESAGPLFDGPAGGEISADDVLQGDLGDCWFLSALGSLAARDPEAVRRAVQPAGDGWVVRLFVPERFGSDVYRPILVPVDAALPTTDAGTRRFGSGADRTAAGEKWVGLIEKALARLFGGYPGLEFSPIDPLAVLTGRPGTNHDTGLRDDARQRLSPAETDALWDALVLSLGAGRPATAGLTLPGGDHAIAVLDARGTGATREVEVRDQAGFFHGTTDRQALPWEQFLAETDEVRF